MSSFNSNSFTEITNSGSRKFNSSFPEETTKTSCSYGRTFIKGIAKRAQQLALLPQRVALSAQEVFCLFNELYTGALAIVTLGKNKEFNQLSVTSSGQFGQALPRLFSSVISVIHPDLYDVTPQKTKGVVADYTSEWLFKKGIELAKPEERLEHRDTKISLRKRTWKVFKREGLSRLAFAAGGVASVFARTADLGLGVLGSILSLSGNRKLHDWTITQLHSLNVVSDVIFALKAIFNTRIEDVNPRKTITIPDNLNKEMIEVIQDPKTVEKMIEVMQDPNAMEEMIEAMKKVMEDPNAMKEMMETIQDPQWLTTALEFFFKKLNNSEKHFDVNELD